MPQGAHSPRSTNESHSGLGQPSMVTWQDGYCLLGHCQDLPRLPTPPQSPDPPKAEPGPFPSVLAPRSGCLGRHLRPHSPCPVSHLTLLALSPST